MMFPTVKNMFVNAVKYAMFTARSTRNVAKAFPGSLVKVNIMKNAESA